MKLRGQRIELGEIESVLHTAPGVVAAAVMVRDDRLVAYVSGLADADVSQVREYAGRRLAPYMVPDTFVVLDDMPRGTSGKIDRKALPAPDLGTREVVVPASDTEHLIVEIVADVLDQPADRVSVTDSFFEIGGHSLSATRVAARISHTFSVSFTVRELFDAPSVRAMAGWVGERLEGHPVAVLPDPGSIPRPSRLPLSAAQQRMWFINQFDPSSPAYNNPFAMRLHGRLDTVALRAALADVITRHEVLRTRYPQDLDGRPWQDIVPADEVTVDQWWRADDVETLTATGFDVTRDLPIRAAIGTESDDHVLVVVLHHIAADGESLRPLVDDLLHAYAARSAGCAPERPPLGVQYADIALWQERVLGSVEDPDSELGRRARWWREQLADLPDVLELPTDRPRPPVASHRGAVAEFDVPEELASAIDGFARRHGVTVFMVLHAAVAVVLSRLAGSTDIALATPVAGRGRAELDALVGMFVNTVVLRTQVDPGAAFADVIGQVRDTDLDAFAAADVPFEHLVDVLAPTRSEAFAPLAQVMLTLEQSAVGAISVPGLTVTPVDAGVPAARFDLMIGMTAMRDTAGDLSGLSGRIVYATDLFEDRTVRRLGARIVDVLTTGLADDTVVVGDIDLTDATERAAIADWSRGAVVGLGWGGRSVGSVVAERVGLSGSQVAVWCGDRVVSYGEFGGLVAGVARGLLGLGVGVDSAVGVVMSRSLELLVAVHAVVVVGGRYVPVEVDAPVERVGYMLSTAGVGVVLTRVGEGVVVPAGVERVVVDCGVGSGVSADVGAVELGGVVDEVGVLSPLVGVYTLFTSGSTGRPKGVTVSQGAVVNRLGWMQSLFPIAGDDVVLWKTPVSFDVSVWELFWPLMVGASVVVAEPGGHRDPWYVASVVERFGVSVCHFVPSMLSVFVDALGGSGGGGSVGGGLGSLRQVFCSGEALGVAGVEGLRGLVPGVRVVNLYGPTEAAVDVTWYVVSGGEVVVPIGRAVPNVSVWVLDSRLRPVPVGVVGELYLGGVQVARGYVNHPRFCAASNVGWSSGPRPA
ncbi:condensation domain-containing protein [Gordonia westfalica]|uniref:condensation domain-containing protein n=1 Tax=Gordonia westfalica TaxID=158898 RepID=UPI0013566B42|nr:condensation domain-containing protein [Gordonia westfalica]